MFKAHPFLFGAQYYRAPTPAPEHWNSDLERMRSLGMNSVKFWAQWRWSHREPDTFYFDDLDQLMDIAYSKGLAIHINVILDTSPHWFYERYPDAHPVLCDGRALGPFEVASRQIGGHPRPCLNHPGARFERQKFFRAVIEHFRTHPGLDAWDVWNEPDLCGPARVPDPRNLADYNPHNIAAFREWLKNKYGDDVEKLNAVWGRCYASFDQAEPPRTGQTFSDFADWRDFHCDIMTEEANWRFATLAEIDPGRLKFLHVVPSVRMWNTVGSATDDKALTRNADLFASTGAGAPWWQPHLAGCAEGRTAWNTEVHIAHGRTTAHPRVIGLGTVRNEILPQIGGGMRGFQFWQFRPESLGLESPAWGIIRLDGSDRPLTKALEEFWKKLRPHAERIARCPPAEPQWALWRGRRNEFVHAAMHGSLDKIISSYQGWLKAMHWRSIPGRVVDSPDLLTGKLNGLELLILAEPYFLSNEEAAAISGWVESGGVLISEAHLGGYNATTGRHSETIPGCGLDQRFGFREAESTSATHLDMYCREFLGNELSDQTKKTLLESVAGGRTFALNTSAGIPLMGADPYAEIAGGGIESIAWLVPSRPVAISKKVGLGTVFYFGTNVGLGAELTNDKQGLEWLLDQALARAELSPPGGIVTRKGSSVRIDHVCDESDRLAFIVAHNFGNSKETVTLSDQMDVQGVFDGVLVRAGAQTSLAPELAELYFAM